MAMNYDAMRLANLVNAHLSDPEARLEFLAALERAWCRWCGRDTGGHTCHCNNDE